MQHYLQNNEMWHSLQLSGVKLASFFIRKNHFGVYHLKSYIPVRILSFVCTVDVEDESMLLFQRPCS